MLPSKHNTQQDIPALLQRFNSRHAACFIPNALAYFQPSFTRRTRGHCLGTFRAVTFPDSPSPSVKIIIVVALSAPHPLVFPYTVGQWHCPWTHRPVTATHHYPGLGVVSTTDFTAMWSRGPGGGRHRDQSHQS